MDTCWPKPAQVDPRLASAAAAAVLSAHGGGGEAQGVT